MLAFRVEIVTRFPRAPPFACLILIQPLPNSNFPRILVLSRALLPIAFGVLRHLLLNFLIQIHVVLPKWVASVKASDHICCRYIMNGFALPAGLGFLKCQISCFISGWLPFRNLLVKLTACRALERVESVETAPGAQDAPCLKGMGWIQL